MRAWHVHRAGQGVVVCGGGRKIEVTRVCAYVCARMCVHVCVCTYVCVVALMCVWTCGYVCV